MKPSEVCQAVLDIYSDESHWMKGSFARTKDNILSTPGSDNACKFCADGAVQHVIMRALPKWDQSTYNTVKLVFGRKARELFPKGLHCISQHANSFIAFNDYHGTTFNDVVLVWKKTKEFFEERGQ